ncbi:MAG: negative regulator of septation ring formation [Faecalicoccus sp.]|nr:negative regulator of septation ring formation [Faecalicoccus sp.]
MESVAKFFQSIYKFITDNIPTDILIYICIALLLLLLLWIVTRTLRRRKAEKRLTDLEVEVNEIRNNQLQYKFNKATAFARVNDEIMERVNNLTPKYNTCIENVATCEDLFNEADELLDSRKVRKALHKMDEIETMLDETKERIRIVTQSLDHILSKETEVREVSNALKERFRNVKAVYQANRASFYDAAEVFDNRIAAVEDEFSNFEEWMFASEFNKAKEEQERISALVDVLSAQIAAYPGMYEKGKVILPQALEEVSNNLEALKEEGIDLSYLNTGTELANVKDDLDTAMTLLNEGHAAEAEAALNAIGDKVLALQDELVQEKQAYTEIHNNLDESLGIVDEIEDDLREIKSLYANIRDRFGLEDWTRRFALADQQLEILKKERDVIEKAVKEEDRPSKDVIQYYRDFSSEATEFRASIKDMKHMLVGATSDESRARKQLVKLQLILNEVRLNAATHQLPNISGQFDDDIKQGENLIARVRQVLDHSPLDVQELNADLQDAIDFVYKLYNNANNLIGVAVMVENAIVFGNRFRSTHPTMDTDLTRAELCFQNGEYTNALKIAIQAIENMHPGVYEKLVAKKDPAVMNTVQ